MEETPQQIESACLAEIEAILAKYKCAMQVTFSQDTVLGQPVLKYQPIIVHIGDRKP